MKPRFLPGEIVRIAGSAGAEAVVEEVAGPNEDGTSWLVNVRLRDGEAGREPVVLDEADVEATGFAEDEAGERVPLGTDDGAGQAGDRLELRLFTGIADGIEAARVAERIEKELSDLVGGATVEIE